MFFYDMNERGNCSLYEYLYHCIRHDIAHGAVAPGEKLPSKRNLAKQLGVSLITVEAAYQQLAAEGYIRTRERCGYYASDLAPATRPCTADRGLVTASCEQAASEAPLLADFTHSTLATETFPYATWAKAVRRTLSDESASSLAEASSAAGSPQLRQAIADHLRESRGMNVHADQIVIGAGSQTLYQLIVQLLGRSRTFAVETPGYPLLARMYEQQSVSIEHIPLDADGIAMRCLERSGASVAHLMPSHQFPTGIVTSAGRRRELLNWAREEDRYLIEDDYDAEFRMAGRPIPPLFSIDAAERVLYLNSFAKSLGAAFRMAYLVLPPRLAQQFHDRLGFYANTVGPLDQLALAHFIESGSYERHVNRLRTRARKNQDALVSDLQEKFGERISFQELNNGLHFIVQVESNRSERDLTAAALDHGIRVASLSHYADDDEERQPRDEAAFDPKTASPEARKPRFVLRSDSIDAESAPTIATALANAWK